MGKMAQHGIFLSVLRASAGSLSVSTGISGIRPG